jgi:hypothetical protein
MSHESQRHSFRPCVEQLEERFVMSAYRYLEPYSHGYWPAGGDHLYFFAVEFHGSLTSANAWRIWVEAATQFENANLSLNANAIQPERTSKNNHLLIGWGDSDNVQFGGWIAADFGGAGSKLVRTGGFTGGYRAEGHTTSNWIANDGTGTFGKNKEGWVTKYFVVNGYHLSIAIVPTASGDIQSYFNIESHFLAQS